MISMTTRQPFGLFETLFDLAFFMIQVIGFCNVSQSYIWIYIVEKCLFDMFCFINEHMVVNEQEADIGIL